MDWLDCPDVEQSPDVMHGAFVVIGTRVPADSIVEHARDGFTAEEIATDIFPSVPLSRAQRLIEFVRQHEAHPA
jgi:uncharacterized protein (DUF433 family)